MNVQHCLIYQVKCVTDARSLDKTCSSFTGASLLVYISLDLYS